MAEKNARDGSSVSQLRATAHPVRLQILSLLTGAAMSAAEVARELGITHANASYHLRLLQESGLIALESEERIRGGVAKRYRYLTDRVQDGVPDGQAPDDAALFAEVTAMTAELQRRFGLREPGKGSFTDAELWVTPEVWRQVLSGLVEASLLLHRQAQPPRTEGTIRTSLSLAAFKMTDEPADPQPTQPTQPTQQTQPPRAGR